MTRREAKKFNYTNSKETYAEEYADFIIDKLFDEFENQNIINRVEIIGKNGREFVKLLENGHYEISIQDDGKTIKLFEKE